MTTLSLDACLKLIADRHRRMLIDELRNNGNGQTTIDDILDRLDREELATRTDRPPDRESLATEFQHIHLPKLADFGVIDYDFERGSIRYPPNSQLETVLDSLPEEVSQTDSSS